MKKRVLLVLPDKKLVARLTPLLTESGYDSRSVGMPDEFSEELRSSVPDVAVINENLYPDQMQAWSKVMLALSPDTRIIDLSTSTEKARRIDVVVHGYVREPFEDETFLAEVKRVLNARPMKLDDPDHNRKPEVAGQSEGRE